MSGLEEADAIAESPDAAEYIAALPEDVSPDNVDPADLLPLDDYFRYVGQGAVDETGPDDSGFTLPAGEGATPPDVGEDSTKLVAFNIVTREQYEVEVPKEVFDELAAYAKEQGLAEGWNPQADKDQPDTDEMGEWLAAAEGQPTADGELDLTAEQPGPSHGWSNAVDTRQLDMNPSNLWPWSATGQLGGSSTSGCTGTLFGRRHVLTAAHCIWNVATQSWTPGNFRPNRRGTCGNVACQPYGGYSNIWFFVPQGFMSVPNQFQHDWGIIVTSGSPGTTPGWDWPFINPTPAPGWLGWLTMGDSSLSNLCNSPFGGPCLNRGWPACGLSGAPITCSQGFAYKDTANCNIGSFQQPAPPDNWNGIFKTEPPREFRRAVYLSPASETGVA